MVTTKGTGLNPNAKVWQEIPAQQNESIVGTEESAWFQNYPPPEMSEGFSEVPSFDSKEYCNDYVDVTSEYCSCSDDMDQPDLGYLVFDPQSDSSPDTEVSKAELTEESLRESLRKSLEFCFSRENLSKDLYLISQMDSDQFIPIWTVACMEEIKALTSDVDLILDVLRACPLVQVDEAGEKVRPNHSRCIIILREVPETTPIEEVEALFEGEGCPKVLTVEFAHNSNWYITFQSDMDALQAYRYLREEVKTFQGKPIMARIKAINTFFGKNGFHNSDSAAYQQHAQPQTQYVAPVYMPQVYSPPQEYPIYPMVSPTWNPSIMPHFETPLAPFPSTGFMNGYSSPTNYKPNTTSGHHPLHRNRSHLKGNPRPGDVLPNTFGHGPLLNGIPSTFSTQDILASSSQAGSTVQMGCVTSFSMKSASTLTSGPNSDTSRVKRDGRRSNYRGMRKREENATNSQSMMEAKVQTPPNFDLAGSSFPPLPGSVVPAQGDPVKEVRLSDVVRGLKVTTKSSNQEDKSNQSINYFESERNNPHLVTPQNELAPVVLHIPTTQQTSASSTEKEEETEPSVEQGRTAVSTQTVSVQPSENALDVCSGTVSAEDSTSEQVSPPSKSEDSLSYQGSRKLSYAEVCQRPPKEPLTETSPSTSPATPTNQPLKELKVNTVEEPRPKSRPSQDQVGAGRPSRHPSRSFRGSPGHTKPRGSGIKVREHQKGLNAAKRFYQQQGPKHSGKEQNIPPTSE